MRSGDNEQSITCIQCRGINKQNIFFTNQRKWSVNRTCNEWPLAYETEHKTFKTMQNIIDANLLAQMASDQIEVNEVVNILDGMYQQMPCDDPEDRDYQLLVAANRLYKANDAEVSKFKKAVVALLERPNDHSAQTIQFGARLIKFYYTPTYHFERVFLPELTGEQLEGMSPEEIKAEGSKRDLLDEMHDLYREIADIEAQLAPKKAKLRGVNEALAAMMPKSKAIHYSPVVQVV